MKSVLATTWKTLLQGEIIVCLDSADVEAEMLKKETTISGVNENAVVIVTLDGVPYKLTFLELSQLGESCSFKEKRGYKCIHEKAQLS